jgi:hypothetical protein
VAGGVKTPPPIDVSAVRACARQLWLLPIFPGGGYG